MYRTLCAIACIVTLLTASAAAQESCSLFGRVVGSDHVSGIPPTWIVKVAAKKKSNDQDVDVQDSRRELYCVKAPTNTLVYLTFYNADYDPQDSIQINTGHSDKMYIFRLIPDATLQRIGTQSLSNKPRQQKREAIRKNLTHHKMAALATKSPDLFQWNIEVHRVAYAGDEDAIAELNQFLQEVKQDPQFHNLGTDEYTRRSALYRDIIRITRGLSTQANSAQVMELVTDKSLFPGIRQNAAQAWTTLKLQPEIREQGLNYFREQSKDSASALYAQSLITLAKVGTATDKQFVISGAKSSNVEQALGSLAAIGEAKLREGSSALAQIAQDEDTNPTIKLAAIQSLSQIQDPTSITTLTVVLEKDDLSYMRVEAAKGLGKLDVQSKEVRDALNKAAVRDISPEVRMTAAGAVRKF